ncbi:1-acyl-sn-glycerol-3-phosphate acyltransferase [Yoonia sp. I 8.24]|uniref:1-acyl-sn-glycerol-3-phosphate acyltransferase n=1 Tax=Yoonia sp. I 8.24 TaxID=1537229 RepID=UPI001EDF6779|nr:1-acyl-sn-glycerol-3-phosphate acyltransferase [Yoonia sp. I 8.24]MCG3266671.1 1-acyl-sn-glycerol-3-phosphate acyltransferase [Yoonia sp. I 8.24]
MEHRIQPLIAERAPWLYKDRPGTKIMRTGLHRMLSYDTTLEIAQTFAQTPAPVIMDQMGTRLAQSVTARGLGHLPAHGAALVVANHPTGIADGIILNHLLARVRRDTYFFANSDILRVLPQMDEMIAPVEWRIEKRCHAKTRETMAYVRKATNAGRMGVIFPSGRLAKRRGLRLYERPWMASAAMLARKFDIPVIPVNIQARNSALFYLFDALHPTLRDITLFHETLNKSKQPFHIEIGEPISASAIPKNPDAGIALLRKATLALGGKDAPAVNMVTTSRPWLKWPQAD